MKNRLLTDKEYSDFLKFLEKEQEKCRQTIVKFDGEESIVNWNNAYRERASYLSQLITIKQKTLLELIKDCKEDIKYYQAMIQHTDKLYWGHCGRKALAEDLLTFFEDLL